MTDSIITEQDEDGEWVPVTADDEQEMDAFIGTLSKKETAEPKPQMMSLDQLITISKKT